MGNKIKHIILKFGIKKLVIISTVAVIGVTGTTVAISSVKKSENAVVEEEKIVINTQSDEDKETEVKKVEEVTEEVANQEVVTETTPQEPETETVKQQTSTNATNTNNSSIGSDFSNTDNNQNHNTDVNNNVSNNNSNMENPKVEEPKVETPTEPNYKTITLDVVTTYYEFTGYFTLDMEVTHHDLVSKGLAENNNRLTCFITEYIDVDTNKIVYFVCNQVGFSSARFFDYVDEVGRGVVPVKTITN